MQRPERIDARAATTDHRCISNGNNNGRNNPMRSTYIMHVIVWILPVVAIQWALAWRTFRRNPRAVFLPPLVLGTFYTLADSVAVREGIWFFDPRQTLGIFVGPLPIEEIIFFYLTALLVSQTFVMLLPARMRRS